MLRVPAAAEGGFWALIRGSISRGGALARIAEALHDALRPSGRAEVATAQLALWVIDAEGLPPRPWRLQVADHIKCQSLACEGLTAGICVARQVGTDAQRTRQASRGQGTDFPSCDTRKCVQGRGIRRALALTPEEEAALWARGSGFVKGRGHSRADAPAQEAARERQERAGLLDEPPTLDEEPETVQD